jgi:hypothetical protein
MKPKIKRTLFSAALAGLLVLTTSGSQAAEIGHFAPGIPNIRDYAVPEPGFYFSDYNYWYNTDRINNASGDKISSITIKPGPGPGLTLAADIDVNIYAMSTTFIWVTDWKILGARYAAYIAPSFATASVGASLSSSIGRGVNSSINSEFGMGDMFVQPVWLGWNVKHFDFALAYGFYAPIGRYKTETVTLPVVGSFQAEAPDNLGLGFWTHQIQSAVNWYPWEDKRMAVASALTYEMHSDKKGFDFTPGSNLTFNWGISQFIPLMKSQKLLMEIGPTGYSSWQVSDDKGRDARNPNVHDEVHAVGGQIGLTYVPWMLSINFRAMHEYSSKDRFQGESYGLSVAKKF